MKATLPWLFVVMAANSGFAFADEALDAYREGNYTLAAQKISSMKTLDPVAQYYLGRMYLYGYGVAKDNTLAIKNIKNAAEKGLLVAQQMMGRYELQENNLPEALYWFKKAATAGDMSAQMYCAAAYLFGLGVGVNPDLARKYYVVAAQHGNAIAQTELAASFIDSRQMVNKKLGFLWLNKAVAQQNPDAQVMMAKLYITGTLVDHDLEKAKEYLTAAMNQNSVVALYTMGEMYQQDKNYTEAKEWYLKAAQKNYIPAYIALSNLYAIEKSPLFNEHESFLTMLKAAQSGDASAEFELSNIYKVGRGVVANKQLADEWLKKSKVRRSNINSNLVKAANWLTLGKSGQFSNTEYRLKGIFSAWQNREFLKEKQENLAPHMVEFIQKSLYQPKFVMLQPNDIPISAYYNALVNSEKAHEQSLNFPRIPLVLAPDHDLFHDNELAMLEEQPNKKLSIDERVKHLESRSLVGDPAAQLELAQRYQYGDGIAASKDDAIKYYQLANLQHDVRASYQLALMYLTDPDFSSKRKEGLDLMTDAAFKGLPQAQYVLGQINEFGFNDQSLKRPSNLDQAIEMYKLAVTNSFGLAQYRLADLLVHQKAVDLTNDGMQKRYALIKSLYSGAAAAGVADATLPLAFYNAMDKDEALRQQAFNVAKQQAETGNPNAALLLALMYDRGLATKADPSLAREWYQKAAMTPVSAFVLGTYMSDGHGMAKNLEKGQELLQKSADAGFMYAYFNLSILKHEKNENFIPDLEQALQAGNSVAGVLLADYYVSLGENIENLRKARNLYQHFAASGDQYSQLKLARLCEQGLGGAVDWQQAGKWYQAAAEQGNAVAQYLLGRLYQLGKLESTPNIEYAHKWYAAASGKYTPAAVANGFIADTVDDDYTSAAKAYELAASKGDAVGQYNLALMYESGKGVLVDNAKAKELYTASANQGYGPAVVRLRRL